MKLDVTMEEATLLRRLIETAQVQGTQTMRAVLAIDTKLVMAVMTDEMPPVPGEPMQEPA